MSIPRAAALVVLLLAGCASATQDGGAGAPSGGAVSPSGSSFSFPASPGRPTPSRLPPIPGGGPTAGEITVTGEVELIEVEGGCLVLRVGKQAYQLMGVDQQLMRPGRVLTVRGRVRSDVMTTCQVGPVIEVSEAVPIR